MDDEQLKELAIAALEASPGSKARRVALTQLVAGIANSGRIAYPKAPGLSPERYRDCRAEALQNLFLFICQNIDRYDPERAPVMRWVNVLLERRFFRESARMPKRPTFQFFQEVWEEDSILRSDTDRLSANPVPFLSDLVRRCLEEDIDRVFSQKHIRNYPEATFRYIALRRLNGYQWQEISDELGIKKSTLSDFYQRCLHQLAPQIRDCVQNLEY